MDHHVFINQMGEHNHQSYPHDFGKTELNNWDQKKNGQ